jgi:hypothetical protein
VSTFRTQEAAASITESKPDVPQGDGSSNSAIVEDTLLATFHESTGKPYVAKYLGIEDIWDEPETGLKGDLVEIENYLRSQVEDQLIENSIEAGKSLLKRLEKGAEIRPEDRTTTKIDKLKAYIRFKSEVREAERNRAKYGKS